MQVRRESVVFAGALLVVAFLSWGLTEEWNDPLRKPSWAKKENPIPEYRVPDLGALPAPDKPSAAAARRDLFAEPRDTRPLEKLRVGTELPIPEAEPYPILMPPPVPGPAPAEWYRWLRAPAAIRPFAFEEGGDGDGGADAPAAPASRPSEASPVEVKQTETILERRYDRVVPKAGVVQWGRILNPNKFDLKPDDPIVFQIYDTKTDRTFAKPITFARADILSYALAKTLRNEIEIRKRKVAWIAGNETRIREFALWCLDKGAEDPEAFAEGERQARRAIELSPNDPINLLLLGKFEEAQFRYEAAWKLYREMTEGTFKANADAWISRAQLEVRLHLDEDARASFLKGQQLDPDGWRPKWVLGDFRLERGRPAEALPLLEGAVKAEPTGVEWAVLRGRIRRRLGDAALALGQVGAAADAYERARKANAEETAALAGLGSVALLQKKAAEARANLDAARVASPSMASLVTSGILRTAAGDFAGARSDFEDAIGLDPVRDVRPLSSLAYLLWLTGHPDDAMAAVERALANEPNDPYARYLRGRMRRERGARGAAREDFKIAAMADLAFIDPVVELGILEAEEDNTELADRYFARALEVDPKNAAIHALRGRNLLVGGQTRRAREEFHATTAIEKGNPLAKIGIGLCSYLDGDGTSMKVELGAVRDGRPAGDRFQGAATVLLSLVDTHERKEEWSDSFDRQSIRLPWTAVRAEGVPVQLQAGEVRIEGLFQGSAEARLSQEVPARLFRSFEADVRIPASGAKGEGNQADVTVFVRQEEKRQGKAVLAFEISVTRERKKIDGATPVRFQFRDKDETPPAVDVAFSWPEDRPVRVRIERNDDDANPKGRVYLDGVLVAQDLRFPKNAPGGFQVGISAAGEAGRAASLSLDSVRIVRRRAE